MKCSVFFQDRYQIGTLIKMDLFCEDATLEARMHRENKRAEDKTGRESGKKPVIGLLLE